MTRLRAAVPLLVLLASGFPALSAADALAPTAICQGRPATITANGGPVTGTEGDDVIATVGKVTVTALGGDDLVCADEGTVDLGAGDDSFVGGANGITIDGDGRGKDTITTKGSYGDDVVISGADGEPNLDVIDLGPGEDRLEMRLPAGSNVDADLGGSSFHVDTIRVIGADTASGEWAIDYGTVVHDGETLATLKRVTVVELAFGPAAHTTVTGTSKKDSVEIYGGDVDVDLGAGSDEVARNGRFSTGPVTGTIDGGPGTDRFMLFDDDATFRGDLVTGRVTAADDVLEVHDFREVFTVARDVVLRGSPAREDLTAWGCLVDIDGRGGNDWMTVSRENKLHCTQRRAVLRGGAGRDYLWGDDWSVRMEGGPGNDFMFGGGRNDVLIGGPGYDKADGSTGRDVCRTEWRRFCER